MSVYLPLNLFKFIIGGGRGGLKRALLRSAEAPTRLRRGGGMP
jgi:hypothetical protein